MILTFSPIHLSASTFHTVRLAPCHANVFCLLPYRSSSGFLPYPLSPGLVISTLDCPDFYYHPYFLAASSLSRLCTCPNHLNHFFLRILPSSTWVPLSRCLHFSHDLVNSLWYIIVYNGAPHIFLWTPESIRLCDISLATMTLAPVIWHSTNGANLNLLNISRWPTMSNR